jgi:Amt family ammonium transporter
VADFPTMGVPDRFGFDDSLDGVGVHMIGGLVGTLLVGLLLTLESPASVTGTGAKGLFYSGGWHQLGMPPIGAFSVMFYSFTVALIIAFVVKLVFGLRTTPEDEELGIDEAEHAETAYDFASVGSGSALSMVGAGKEA